MEGFIENQAPLIYSIIATAPLGRNFSILKEFFIVKMGLLVSSIISMDQFFLNHSIYMKNVLAEVKWASGRFGTN